MTKDQFAVWLTGYMTINVFSKSNYGQSGIVDYQKMGDDVLEAARSVVSALAPLCAGPVFEREMPLTPATPAMATTGQLDTKRIPQPGDLDYEDTSAAEQK